MTKAKTKTKKTTKGEAPVSTTTELTNKLIQLLLDRPDLVSFTTTAHTSASSWACKIANVDVFTGSYTAMLASGGIRVHLNEHDAQNLIVTIKKSKASSMLASVYEATTEQAPKSTGFFSFLFG